jgi:hypothetical protein
MSRTIFTLASSLSLALSFAVAQTADARPLSLASADRDTPVCVDEGCEPPPCVDDGCDCVDDGCEPEIDLDFCVELNLDIDVSCVIKVADDCEDNCNARSVTPACLQKLGPRAGDRALADCQADYQAICVSQCEGDGGGFCGDIWVGADICIDLDL